jgi:outer membrane protein, multidrug efflux system
MTSPSNLPLSRCVSACAQPAPATFRRASFSLCLIATLLLGACASTAPITDPSQAGVPLPTAWTQASTSGSATPSDLGQWWQRFNDPQLTQLIDEAQRANTDVRVAQATLRQARAVRDEAAAGWWPTLDASASAKSTRSASAASTNLYQAGFDAAWEPDIFGSTRSAVSAADADAAASAASLADTQVSIAAEVAVDYMNLRGYQMRLAIARNNLAAQEETLQITQWRAQAGLATSLDVEQARTTTEQTRANLPALEASIAQTEHALAVLVGKPPAALIAALQASTALPTPPADIALDVPAQTLRQRADVRAAERKVRAALARVDEAQAARYPSFNLSGSIGLSALTVGALTGGGTVASSLLASVSVPLFDGGALRAAVRAQDAALEQARVNYEAAILTALKDVEDALVALRTGRERLATLRNASDAATNAALLARQRYSSGLIDFLTVLDTQRTQLSAQDSVASAEAELGADYVRLYKALGGGWQPQAHDEANAAPQAPQQTTASGT